MEIVYLGPSDSVNVAPYGPHGKGDIKEYPDDFALELLATSKKQTFGSPEKKAPALEDMTVDQLKTELGKDFEIPSRITKKELIDLVLIERNQAQGKQD